MAISDGKRGLNHNRRYTDSGGSLAATITTTVKKSDPRFPLFDSLRHCSRTSLCSHLQNATALNVDEHTLCILARRTPNNPPS